MSKQWKSPGWLMTILIILLFASVIFFNFALIFSEGQKEVYESLSPAPQDFQRTQTFIHTKENQKSNPSIKVNIDKASWYDYSLPSFPNYSKDHYTAASRDYPRGTMLWVCRIDKTIREYQIMYANYQQCVDVRVNDYVENPDVIIDLSSAAFRNLAPLSWGIIEVEIIEL